MSCISSHQQEAAGDKPAGCCGADLPPSFRAAIDIRMPYQYQIEASLAGQWQPGGIRHANSDSWRWIHRPPIAVNPEDDSCRAGEYAPQRPEGAAITTADLKNAPD